MKKGFWIYLFILIAIELLLFMVMLSTAWDDGSPEGVDSTNRFSSYLLKFVLGFPTGLFFETQYDMRILLLTPVNAAVQYFGFFVLKERLASNNGNPNN